MDARSSAAKPFDRLGAFDPRSGDLNVLVDTPKGSRNKFKYDEDLGLFRLGGERYAELDHHYGATTLEKRHVTVTRDGMVFDYIAKAGKHRAITVTDEAVLPTVRALARSDNGLDTLFSYQHGGSWRIHSGMMRP